MLPRTDQNNCRNIEQRVAESMADENGGKNNRPFQSDVKHRLMGERLDSSLTL